MKKFAVLATIFLVAVMVTGCKDPEPMHEHTFADSWSKNATHHWEAATCEHKTEVRNKSTHFFGAWTMTEFNNSNHVDNSVLELNRDFLMQAVKTYTEYLDLESLLDYINCSIIEKTNADGGAILLLNELQDSLSVKSLEGHFPPPYCLPEDLPHKIIRVETNFRYSIFDLEDNIFGIVAKSGIPELITDPLSDSRMYQNEPEEFLKLGTYIFVPLIIEDKVIGVISLARKFDKEPFSESEFNIAKILTSYAGSAVNKFYSFKESMENSELRLYRECTVCNYVERENISIKCRPIYTITFDLSGGFKTDNITSLVQHGEKLRKPRDPISPDGETPFIGWVRDNTFYDFNDEVTSSFTLHAVYGIGVTTSNVEEVIGSLKDEGTYNIIVLDEISSQTITNIINALKSNATLSVNLDLSKTRLLTSITPEMFMEVKNLIGIQLPEEEIKLKKQFPVIPSITYWLSKTENPITTDMSVLPVAKDNITFLFYDFVCKKNIFYNIYLTLSKIHSFYENDKTIDVKSLLDLLNKSIFDTESEPSYTINLVAIKYNSMEGTVQFCMTGAFSFLIYDRDTDTFEFILGDDKALGTKEFIEYKNRDYCLKSGDILVPYTNILTNNYSLVRMMEVIKENKDLSARDIGDVLEKDIMNMVGTDYKDYKYAFQVIRIQ